MYSGQRPEAIDTRLVFRVYAVIACLGGFVLTSWGQRWFGSDLPGLQWGKAALIRVLGAFIMAAGCCAAGFAAQDNPSARRRGLLWFAIGHSIVWLMVLMQTIAIWSMWTPGLSGGVAQLLFAIVLVLFYLWGTSEGEYAHGTTLLSLAGIRPVSAERLRSQYEQQIREVARQEERNRLARDLHDSIKQQIFVIQTAAATAQARFDADSAGAKQAIEQIRGSSREAMTEMQAMLDQLHAEPLENSGLIEALGKQCEALGFRTGAHVEFKLGDLPPSPDLPPGAQEAILRVAQEALANVGRHARALNAWVSLDSAHGYVNLKISDDGAGFDPNQGGRGQGIANMRARAEEFGGSFKLTSWPGNGTYIALSIPYTAGETSREYRRRVVQSGAMLAISLLVLAWTKSIVVTAVCAIAAVGLVRYVIAYRRAQKRAGSAR